MSKSPQRVYSEAIRAWNQAHMQYKAGLGGFGVTVDCRDLIKLRGMIAAMGGLPPKIATAAAGQAATIVKRKAKTGEVPVRTGTLKANIVRTKKERSRTKGKAVYRVDFKGGEEANSVLQKPVKNPGAAGSTQTGNGHAYYPYSMEYGYITRDGGYWPGLHFMKAAAEESWGEVQQKVISVMISRMEKEWGEA